LPKQPSTGTVSFRAASTGISSLLFRTASNSHVQLSNSAAIRGRVMSLYMLELLGGKAVG